MIRFDHSENAHSRPDNPTFASAAQAFACLRHQLHPATGFLRLR
jgi:hypothetical protein